ncbi:basic helix-loop-helix protein [Pichia californica]|uniref:Basic helix-loop-helix protein n=1 Tax=Pichia californica TaxID=460514 RepID=A0A9P6WHE4_9ASCO|nr:basic helix-loop-helix protein [[Candida] californica]KAG0687186.1 basic helix-loop-helix protein [[Candida] californica]
MTKRQSEVLDSVESSKKQKPSDNEVIDKNLNNENNDEIHDNINDAADNVAKSLNDAIAENTAPEENVKENVKENENEDANEIDKLDDQDDETKDSDIQKDSESKKDLNKPKTNDLSESIEDNDEQPGEQIPNIKSVTSEVSVKLPISDPIMLANIKKLNHKEVERRRRETINNAINELQDLVPTTHTNKAQIIRKASEFIKKLKEKEETLVNKWTLEKIITDQAISELANSNEKLKSELEKAYREIEHRKNVFEKFIELVNKQDNSEEVNSFLSKINELFQEEEDDDEEYNGDGNNNTSENVKENEAKSADDEDKNDEDKDDEDKVENVKDTEDIENAEDVEQPAEAV